MGEGATAVTTRFGSDTAISGGVVRTFIDAARGALNNPLAEVVLRLEDVQFKSGHDLETFLEKQNIEAGTGDIEQ